jgi:hypothetical protein
VGYNPLNLGDLNFNFAPSQDKQEKIIVSLLKFKWETPVDLLPWKQCNRKELMW